MILQIKRGNRVIAESADFSYSPSLQEVRKLTCEVVSVVPIEFKAYNSKSESEYDTVVYNGNTFILYQAPSGDNLNEAGKYKYSLLFYGKEVLLQNVAFLDIVSGTGGEINKIRYTHGGLFQFWGDAKQLAARIEANIESYNASLGVGYTGIGTWTLNVDAEGELTEDMIDITDGTNLFEALKNFYDKFYLNYYFSTTANGGIITITDKTRPSVNWTFKQGDGGGAVKVSSSVDTSTPVITRIIPQGGSRNVPPEYKKGAKPADESRYCPYILLPNDSDGNIRYYLDSEYGLKNYGVRGKTISNTFSGIYPSIRGKKLGDLYPSGLPEWDTYKADGEPDPQSGKVAGEGASASTRIDKIIGSTPIKSDDSDSFFIYMTSPGFNLGYKVYEDGDSSDKINDNVQPQYKPHAMFDKYRDFESFDIYGTRAYYDQPVKATASFSGKMLFSILPIGSDAVGKKVKINLRMVLNRVLGQASPLKEVVIGEEGATGMLEIPYDKTALVGYIEKGKNTTVTIRIEFTFDSDVPAGSCKIGFSEEMTCNIHFGNQDGSQDRFYYKYASVTDAVFSMRTGTYTGTEFKINKNGIIPLYGEVNGDTGETEEDVAMFNKGARYKISCYRTDSDNAKLPLYTDGKSPSIAAGTEFVILNIVMPESYVTMAENTLEKAALDYLSRYDHENRTVSLDISSGFVAEHPNLFIDFIEGNMLKVRDDGIGVFDFSDNGQIVDMQLQIQSLEIKYSKDNMFPSYSCTIARRKILSFYERLAQENQTASTQNTTNVTLGGSGTGSGTNIFSEQLLNDLIASFQKFNGWFEWDEANQALRCKSAFYTNQWISALGAQSGSGEPGGGEGGLIKAVYGFADLGKTFDDSNLSNTFNAYTINEIWKLAKEGGMNTDKLWQELGKDDPTKKIHISHLPDNKFVTLDTEQTVTASKIFTGQLSTANVVPSVNNASTLGLESKRWENIYAVDANISGTVKTQALQVGDIKIIYDSVNKAVTFEHADGNTEIGFYTRGWISALGVSPGGSGGSGGDGLVKNVYGFSNLGTTFSDSDLDNTFNAYTINEIWKMAGQGGLDADAMWAELKKADSSKIIDASHIPTSVLDGRWVKKTGDTMTGTFTSASTSGSIVFKGVENCDITNIYKDNGVIRNDDGGLTSIRNGLRFNWYDTYWYIGNLRGSSTESAGFGVVDHNNKLVLRVTPNDVRAPRFMSTVATGTAPFMVSSTTQVSNLNADLLDGYHAFGTSNALIKYGYTVRGTEPAWCRIATYSIRNTETMTDVCFVLHSAYSDLFGLLVVRTRGGEYVQGLLIASYNINRSNIRIYHDAEKKNIELYCYGGSTYSIIQANLLYSHDRNGWANTNITLYMADTKAPSWSTYVNPGFANLQNSSEAAKKLQTPRTLWGQSFDGTANVSGNMTGVGSINMSGQLTSTVASGTAPFIVASNTVVGNLNADLLDGNHGAYYQNRMYDGFVSQYQTYDYIEFLRFVIPSGQYQLRAYVVFDLCRTETGYESSGRAVLRLRRNTDNTASTLFYVTNFGRSTLPELRCTSDDGITWRIWMKCNKSGYDPYIAVKIVEQYPYGYVTTQNNGTTGTPEGTRHVFTALSAGISNAANIWTNARTFYIQDHNASHTGAGVSVNGSANVYLKLPNSIQCSGWFRSTGNSGWYHQDYGGGWYMQDSTYIRNFGSKRLRIQTDTYDTLQLVRSSGSGGSSIAFYNGGGTFRGQLGVNASSWFSFNTGTATANQNVVEISPAGGIHSKAEITAKASGSDIRLKKDIQNYNAMDIINKFRSVKYHWNDVAKANSEVYNNDYDQFGLIAQDLIAGGFKQWVRDVFHDYYTVTYERLIPVVWKGLQEVDDEVTRLKKRVRELENRLGIYNQ